MIESFDYFLEKKNTHEAKVIQDSFMFHPPTFKSRANRLTELSVIVSHCEVR